jgi:hypothetical protein
VQAEGRDDRVDRALACNGGHGCLLAYDGPGIEADVEALGNDSLADHGFDDAPDGLSIWEGTLKAWRSSGLDGDDYETELVGAFRSLTDREWYAPSRDGRAVGA